MSLYHYGREQNHTMKEIYESLLDYIKKDSKKAEWNISDIALRFSQEKLTKHYKTMANATLGDDEWKYFNKLEKFYTNLMKSPEKYNWSTKKLGSFLIKLLIWQFSVYKNPCANIFENRSVYLDTLHKIFSIPGQNVSLPDIGYLYSLIDYNAIKKRYAYTIDFSKLNIKPSLKKCFDDIEQKYPKSKNVQSDFEPWPMTVSEKYSNIFPCLERDKYPLCSDYCEWHDEFFKQLKKDEFMTIMRYSLPQRKINLNPILPTEPKMAEQVFGAGKILNELENLITKTSLVAFCYQKQEGFVGENIGISENVCSDFFPAPTDAGICFSKNIDIKKVMITSKSYEKIFETESQNPHINIKGGTLWTETTLVINTGYAARAYGLAQTYEREKDVTGGQIQFQLHESKEIANILLDNNYNKYTIPLNLQNGHEYWIDVTPTGKISTEGFKVRHIWFYFIKIFSITLFFQSIGLSHRKCRLENEVFDNTNFKIYTKNNCNYECHVKLATEICKCIPWDFIQKSKVNECDVFGRTCFYNTMKNLTKGLQNFCKHCVKECDYIKFNKQIIKDKIFADIDNKKTRYSVYLKNIVVGKKCFGSKVLLTFIDICMLQLQYYSLFLLFRHYVT